MADNQSGVFENWTPEQKKAYFSAVTINQCLASSFRMLMPLKLQKSDALPYRYNPKKL